MWEETGAARRKPTQACKFHTGRSELSHMWASRSSLRATPVCVRWQCQPTKHCTNMLPSVFLAPLLHFLLLSHSLGIPQDPLQHTLILFLNDAGPQLFKVAVRWQFLKDGMSMGPVKRYTSYLALQVTKDKILKNCDWRHKLEKKQITTILNLVN